MVSLQMPKTRTSNKGKHPGLPVSARSCSTPSSSLPSTSSAADNDMESAMAARITQTVMNNIQQELRNLADQGTSAADNAQGNSAPSHFVDDSSDSDYDDDESPNLATSLAAQLGQTLDEKMKRHILPNKYIPFSSLLKSTPKEEFTLRMSNGNLSLAKSSDNEKRLSRDEWNLAFFTFAAVYTLAKPLSSPALFKYAHTINSMAARGMDWLSYDENFRKTYQGQSEIPWGDLHTELYLKSFRTESRLNSGFHKKSNHNNKKRPQPFRPAGQCWFALANNGHCRKEDCQFAHKCAICDKNHPSNKCRSKPKVKPNTNKP